MTPSARAPGNGPRPTAETKKIAQISSEILRRTLRMPSAQSRIGAEPLMLRAARIPSGRPIIEASTVPRSQCRLYRWSASIARRAPTSRGETFGRLAPDHRERVKQFPGARIRGHWRSRPEKLLRLPVMQGTLSARQASVTVGRHRSRSSVPNPSSRTFRQPGGESIVTSSWSDRGSELWQCFDDVVIGVRGWSKNAPRYPSRRTSIVNRVESVGNPLLHSGGNRLAIDSVVRDRRRGQITLSLVQSTAFFSQARA